MPTVETVSTPKPSTPTQEKSRDSLPSETKPQPKNRTTGKSKLMVLQVLRCICLRSCYFELETRVIMKNEFHPW